MSHKRFLAALLAFGPLVVVPAACGDDADDRVALEQEELERELDLALEGDTAPTTFEDTAVGPTEEPGPVAQPAPRPQTARPQAREATREPTRPRPAPAREEPRVVSRTAPAGATVGITLNQTLSTETNVPGDPFSATLSEPILAADGSVVVPAGATVRGRVTALDKSERVGETAMIKVAFESISFGGDSYALDASVIEANPERKTRTSTKEQAAKIGAGAAAGAILGKVIGKDNSDAVKGAVIGAAAGTAIAMGTADVDAVLPQGSRMVIRLDGPIIVRTAG